MTSFGDFLPEEERRAFLKRHLTPGQILYIFTKFPQKQKEKYLLVVCDDGRIATFVINSEIHPFIKKRSHLLKAQIVIKKSEYTFLDHDSYIDCTKVNWIEREYIAEQILNETNRVKERIYTSTKASIVKAVKRSDTITVEDKIKILEALQNIS